MKWSKGIIGLVHTPHRGDSQPPVKAKLMHDSPSDQEQVRVKLLEDFYCCEAGETIKTQRYLFVPQ